MTERATVRVESIAAGGAGIARLDGLAVFIPRTAVGDVAEIELRRRRRFAEGRVLRLLEPGAHRVEPRCAHYGASDHCGGCQLQHLDESAQRAAKRRIVSDALSRIGRRDVAVAEVVASPQQWEYRNKLTLTMRRTGRSWTIGLRQLGAPDSLFPLRECPVTDASIVRGWREVVAAAAALPPAPELRGAIRRTGNELGFVLEGGTVWASARAFVEACPSLAVVLWVDQGARRHVVHDRRSAAGTVASFEQVNPPVAAAVRDYVCQLVGEAGPASLVDAYAGSGALAARLADGRRRVVAIERDREAAAHARAALGDRGGVIRGAVEDHLAAALPADAVIVNPPRSGLHTQVCEALERASPRPRLIVYVSCDPATLGRDVTRLPSYVMRSAVPFDMFPQTAHVETVGSLAPVGT